MYIHEMVPSRGIIAKADFNVINEKDQKAIRSKNFMYWIKSLMRTCIHSVYDFANLTSIHGVKHFTHKDRHPIEHVVWVLFLLMAIGCAMSVSLSTWRRYQDNPTVISMERDYKEWNTSVPAGTLCPHTRVDQKALTRIVQNLAIGWGENDRQLLRNFLIDISNATYANFENLNKYLDAPNNLLPNPEDYLRLINTDRWTLRCIFTWEILHIYLMTTNNYDDILQKWRYIIKVNIKMDLKFDVSSSLENSPVYTVQTVTELGICWSFNSPQSTYNTYSYWKAGKWELLPDGQVMQCYPLSGEVYLQVTNLNSGYQFLVHAPTEVADVAGQIHSSSQDYYTTLDLTALSIYSSEEAQRLTPAQRSCRLPHESDLTLAPAYSYSLCRVQCRMTLAYSLCSCVPHFYRPQIGYKICDVSGLVCLSKYAQTLIKLRNETSNEKISCPCLPSCDDVTYISERDNSIPWDLGTNIKWGITRYPRMRLKRDILFGFTDLLVSIGGTVGLFLGCSLLGCLEIAYFFTLRLILSINLLFINSGNKGNIIKKKHSEETD